MAAVNRFTRIQPGNYNPMSLQELMLVPQYKRQQHDKLLEASAGMDTGLAQVDPLSIHNESARAEQERLSKALEDQVNLLNSEGFNPSSKSAFINLNKDYQRTISPTGTLGRINQAKQVLNENKQSYLNDAIKQGYSPEAALANWSNFENQYIQKFQEDGEITNIGQIMAPKYFDYIEEAKDIFKDVGVTSEEIESGGGRIVKNKKGQYVVNSKEVNESNISQLQSAVDFLNNQILNPNSDAYKSIVHQGKAIPDVLNEIVGLANVYRKTDSSRSSMSSISNFKANEIQMGMANNGLTAVTSRFDGASIPSNYSSLTDKIEELNELSINRELTQDEKYTLSKYNKVKKLYDKTLSKNPKGQELINSIEKIENDSNYKSPQEEVIEKQLAELRKNPYDNRLEIESLVSHLNLLSNSKNQILNSLRGELDEIISDQSIKVKLMSDSYAVTPVTTKQQSINKIVNNSFGSLVTESPQALEQNTNILRVADSEGEEYDELTENDKSKLSKLVFQANKNDIEVVSFIPETTNGLPGYKIKVKTKDSYNLDNVRKGSVGGEDGFITLDVTFKNNNNGIVKNINGYIQQYLSSIGKDGVALAFEMNSNAARYNYRGKKWSEVDMNNISLKNEFVKEVNSRVPEDEVLTKELYNKIANDLMSEEIQ